MTTLFPPGVDAASAPPVWPTSKARAARSSITRQNSARAENVLRMIGISFLSTLARSFLDGNGNARPLPQAGAGRQHLGALQPLTPQAPAVLSRPTLPAIRLHSSTAMSGCMRRANAQ